MKLVLLNSRSQKNPITMRFWEGVNAVRHQHNLLPHEVLGLIMPLAYSSAFLADETKVKALLEIERYKPYPQSSENFRLQTQAIMNFDAIACAPQLTMPILMVGGTKDILEIGRAHV